jgi:hypothetical protein
VEHNLLTKASITKGEIAGSEHDEMQKITRFTCPQSVSWEGERADKDLHISTPIMTILAMDGRRRWLDIKKLVGIVLLSQSVTVLIWDLDISSNASFFFTGSQGGLVCACDQPSTMCGIAYPFVD